MDYFSAFQISGLGMRTEQARFEAAAYNLSIANSALPPGKAAEVRRVIPGQISFQQILDQRANWVGISGEVAGPNTVAVSAGVRQVQEPGHPFANAQGWVNMPVINSLDEMLTVMSATRAYESNLVTFNAAKSMYQKALELGGNS